MIKDPDVPAFLDDPSGVGTDLHDDADVLLNAMTHRMIASVNGIRCAGCLTAIERALLRQGASSVAIDPATRIATILYTGTRTDANAYCDAVRAAGYRATLFAVLPVAPAE